MAEAEKDKERMAAEIEQLTADKRELEAKNAAAVDENRSLLDQLESVNNAVSESDSHVQFLTKTLQSTQSELHKLNNLASRTDKLERELVQYEVEQANLHAALASKAENEKAMTIKWHEAERKMIQLETQLEMIDRDARVERERHVQIVGRMERQRVVEEELDTAGGRLGGAAAAKTMAREKHGSTVVSHFVKDILQDNANLQVGIVELREMLTTSNDEVERLRDQLANYFPPDQTTQDVDVPDTRRLSTLSQEMASAKSQQLHVHHHYHAPSDSSSRRQSQTVRRPKKKRQGLTSGIFTPTSGSRTPRSSISGMASLTSSSSTAMFTPASSAATPLSQTAASVLGGGKNRPFRWSMQSAYTMDSSIASSPPSTTFQAPSLFDRGFSDAGMESSRPTTPDSEVLGSPDFASHQYQSKRGSAGYFRSISETALCHGPQDDAPALDQRSPHLADDPDGELYESDEDAILEEDEQDLLDPCLAPINQHSPHAPDFRDDSAIATGPTNPAFHIRPGGHRRAASHESLISIHGMDIHTLKSRPSQLLAATSHHVFPVRGGAPFAGINRAFSSQPVVGATMASATMTHTARPALTPRSSDTGHSLLSGMAADQRAVSAGGGVTAATRPALGKKAGSWLFGRWGATAASTVAASTPLNDMPVVQKVRNDGAAAKQAPVTSATPASASASASASAVPPPLQYKLRQPGINQSGPIWGFGPEPQLPAQPVLLTLDEEALRQSLSEA